MSRRKFVPGYRQGSWTILEAPYQSKKLYLRCDCGHEGWYWASNLSSNKSTQCWECRIDTPEQHTFKLVKATARRRGIEWLLSFDEWLTLAQKNCFYCGVEPSNKLARGIWCNGIDRMDSSKHYELSNCVTSCKVCNRAKSNLSYDDFMDWIKNVYEKSSSV